MANLSVATCKDLRRVTSAVTVRKFLHVVKCQPEIFYVKIYQLTKSQKKSLFSHLFANRKHGDVAALARRLAPCRTHSIHGWLRPKGSWPPAEREQMLWAVYGLDENSEVVVYQDGRVVPVRPPTEHAAIRQVRKLDQVVTWILQTGLATDENTIIKELGIPEDKYRAWRDGSIVMHMGARKLWNHEFEIDVGFWDADEDFDSTRHLKPDERKRLRSAESEDFAIPPEEVETLRTDLVQLAESVLQRHGAARRQAPRDRKENWAGRKEGGNDRENVSLKEDVASLRQNLKHLTDTYHARHASTSEWLATIAKQLDELIKREKEE